MAKELPYFQFEPAKYLTGDISFCSLEAQGLFINICSYYWQRECKLTKQQFLKRINKEELFIELVEEGVIDLDKDNIIIKFLDQLHDEAINKSKTNSLNGSKGGRPKNKNPKETEIKPNKNPKETETKGIREDNIREDNTIKEKPPTPKGELPFKYDVYLEEINKMFGRNHKVVSDKLKRSIQARLREGYKNINFHNAMINVKNNDFHKETNYVHVDPYFFAQESKLSKYGDKIRNDNKPNKIGATTEYYQHD